MLSLNIYFVYKTFLLFNYFIVDNLDKEYFPWPLKENKLENPLLLDKDNQGQNLKDIIRIKDIFL